MKPVAEKHPCDIFKVAAQCGVRLLDPSRHRPGRRRPRDCFAKKTMKKIGQRHGEAHLALVLRLVVESEGNATELYRETLQAISAVLAGDEEIANRGGDLFEDFDRIDLATMRQEAKGLAVGMPVSQIMRVMIALKLRRETPAKQLEFSL